MNIRDPKKLTGITAFVLVITALIVIPMGIMSGRLGARWNGVSTALLILVFGFIALGAIAWIFSRILGGFVRRELWRGEYDEALRWMRRLGPAGDRKYTAVILALAARPAEAEKILRNALANAATPQTRAAELSMLGESLMDQGRYEESRECLEEAIRLDLGNGSPCVTLAEWYLLRKTEPQKALDLVESSFRCPGFRALPDAVRTKILGSRLAVKACALARLGLRGEAEAAISEAFRLGDSRSVFGMALLNWRAGVAYASMGESLKSREYFDKAAAIDPNGKYGKLAAAS